MKIRDLNTDNNSILENINIVVLIKVVSQDFGQRSITHRGPTTAYASQSFTFHMATVRMIGTTQSIHNQPAPKHLATSSVCYLRLLYTSHLTMLRRCA